MASNVTLLELRDRLKTKADLKNSGYFEDEELDQFINDVARDLYDKLVAVNEDYFTEETTLTVDGSASQFTLPTDFYKLVSLHMNFNGEYVQLHKYIARERYSAQANGLLPKYRLKKNSVVFNSVPSAQSMPLAYVPALPALVDDTDTFDGINGWDDYIVVKAAITCLGIQETETTALEKELLPLTARIESMAPNRDHSTPERVSDVTRTARYAEEF